MEHRTLGRVLAMEGPENVTLATFGFQAHGSISSLGCVIEAVLTRAEIRSRIIV